jgi:cytochrome c5
MDNHQSNAEQDAVFVRNFGFVLALLTVIGIGVFVLANAVSGGSRATQDDPNAAAERTAPVGTANTSGAPIVIASTLTAPASTAPASAAPAAATVAVNADPGQATYDGACFACHATGAGGAPKMGDVAAWTPRVAQGKEVLYTHAINGYVGKAGMMPAKGGRPDMSDDAIKAGIDYMVSKSQ